MTPLDSLKRFEEDVDAMVAALPIMELPARVLLAGIHRFLFQTRSADVLGLPEMPGMADRIGTRVSSLLALIATRPGEPSSGSALEVLERFTRTDPDGRQSGTLLQYMQFSETMPEARKGWYEVSERGDAFELTHRDGNFSRFEARDILLSELALVFPLDTMRLPDPELAQLVRTAPDFDPELLGRVLGRKAHRLSFGAAMPNLVTEEGMRHIFGFRYKTFYRIRAAILAYAELCVDMARALSELDRSRGLEGLSAETLEWISVTHEAGAFLAMIGGLSGATIGQVDRFMELVTIDFRSVPARHHGRDGFFPPYARFERSFAFSPELVMSQTHLRNFVLAFAEEQAAAARAAKERADATAKAERISGALHVRAGGKGRKEKRLNPFDARVSSDFEAVMVGQAVELLRNSADWIVRPNVRFDDHGQRGEIDLVVAGADGATLLLQAKGMMPPHGARLTRNLASQMTKAIGQVTAFRSLTPELQERIVGRAVGRPAFHAGIRHGLLARSCFGTPEVEEPELDLLLLTLPLLSLALGRMRAASDPADVDLLARRLREVEGDYLDEAGFAWTEGEYRMGARRIVLPRLTFDEAAVDRYRRRAWSDSEIMDPAARRSRARP